MQSFWGGKKVLSSKLQISMNFNESAREVNGTQALLCMHRACMHPSPIVHARRALSGRPRRYTKGCSPCARTIADRPADLKVPDRAKRKQQRRWVVKLSIVSLLYNIETAGLSSSSMASERVARCVYLSASKCLAFFPSRMLSGELRGDGIKTTFIPH